MNACHRIFVSLTVVGLAVLAGPIPTADAAGIPYAGSGRVPARPMVPVAAPVHYQPVQACPPVQYNRVYNPTRIYPTPVPSVIPRPGWNAYTGLRPGWAVRPYDKYWTGYGVVGVNWFPPSYAGWYYPGYTFRVPYYYSNPTTYIDLTSPGFTGGLDGMAPALPSGNPLLNLSQPSGVPLPQ